MQNDGLTLQTVVLHWNIERRRNNCTVLIRDVNFLLRLVSLQSVSVSAGLLFPKSLVRNIPLPRFASFMISY